MRELLSREIVSVVLVHDRALEQPANSVSERTSPRLCSVLLRVVSHRIARLLDYATVHGTLPPGRCKYEMSAISVTSS
jgi:hypothetical protein